MSQEAVREIRLSKVDSGTKRVLMRCGCVATATDTQTGRPVCVVHAGLTPDADIPAEAPDLTGRRARCAYYSGCGVERDSSLDLAFFEYHPEQPYDTFYCGCHGWD